MKVWMRGRCGAFQRFAGAVDILEAGARQAADAGALDELGDLAHRLEIAGRGNRKTRFDDIDAHFVEQFGDLQFFFMRHRRARRLLAVAQSGVENLDSASVSALVGHDISPSVRRVGASVSPFAFIP